MAKIEIIGVEKSFGSIKVIDNVNISIPNGEFIVLVGPSGCGKTTLLRSIAGLEMIDKGEIIIENKIVNRLPPKDRDVAMVFQNYGLYPHKTVFDNIGFSLKVRHLKKIEILNLVKETANILGLRELLNRYPRELSGGQRQRVAMGRAIVRNPKAFLFDEPLSNLDAKLRAHMRIEIKVLHQRIKTTTIYVTHDQVEAMTMADRIVVMNEGRVEQIGTPLELFDRPANLFVAGFIGSPTMNFISGTIESENGLLYIESDDSLRISLTPNIEVQLGTKVVCGFRPGHLSLVDQSDGMKATVRVVEPTGDDTLVICRLGNKDICAHFNKRLTIKPGDIIHLTPIVNNLHIFEADSGKRI